ncbi:hypothetical protein CIHG_01126 [Coccidioides immitis H538.4]|uniref:Uncharacterized protein n=1 Tax=Coccidioides immitis H538.4 TaxID=396776 RepID=A0A0J8RH70_COCIT|nr:hypothetical protein CIHG_01126 [Coccidioides immitis H538.4]
MAARPIKRPWTDLKRSRTSPLNAMDAINLIQGCGPPLGDPWVEAHRQDTRHAESQLLKLKNAQEIWNRLAWVWAKGWHCKMPCRYEPQRWNLCVEESIPNFGSPREALAAPLVNLIWEKQGADISLAAKLSSVTSLTTS